MLTCRVEFAIDMSSIGDKEGIWKMGDGRWEMEDGRKRLDFGQGKKMEDGRCNFTADSHRNLKFQSGILACIRSRF